MIIIDVRSESITTVSVLADQKRIKKTYFCPLAEVVSDIKDEDQHLLLPTDAFIYYETAIEYASRAQFTITDYKRILKEKIAEFRKNHNVPHEHITITLLVGGAKNDAGLKKILGKTGKISRKRHFQALNAETMLVLHSMYGSKLDTVPCYPRNQFFLASVGTIIHRTAYSCLLISPDRAELRTVYDGVVTCYSYAPLGFHILLEATHEHGVEKYLFDTSHAFPNPFVEKLLTEALVFYRSTLLSWVNQTLDRSIPLVVCTDTFHDLFLTIGKELFEGSGTFMIPLTPKQLPPECASDTIDGFIVQAYMTGNGLQPKQK